MWPFKKKNEFDVSNFGKTMGYVPYKSSSKPKPIQMGGVEESYGDDGGGSGRGGAKSNWFQLVATSVAAIYADFNVREQNSILNQPKLAYLPNRQQLQTNTDDTAQKLIITFFILLFVILVFGKKKTSKR
ncbi:MAG: hypothetical protein EAZ14_01885 [Runella slithyformis]|nr:MAG: hypothetical protein EAZ14_01885 [Runella slithyformis]